MVLVSLPLFFNCSVIFLTIRTKAIYKKTKIDWTSSFYISKTRKKITYHDHGPLDANAYYVLDTIKYDVPATCTHIESFNVREHKRTLFILKCDNGVSE